MALSLFRHKSFGNALLFLVALGVVAALVSYAWLGRHSRYLADDFGFAAGVRADGFVRTQISTYLQWSGRISSTFFSSIVALAGAGFAPLLPALLLLLLTAAFHYALAALLPEVDRRRRFVLACAFVWAICDGAADVFESLYWPSGSVAYLAPLIFLALAVAFIARGQAAPAAILALLVATSSEMMAAIAVAAAGVTALLLRTRASIAAAGAAVCGFIIVVASPGNAARRAHFNAAPPFFEWIRTTVVQSGEYLLQFIARGGVQALLLLILFALIGVTMRARAVPAWAVALLAIVIANGISVHTGYGYPPARGLTVVDVFVFAAVTITGGRLHPYVVRREALAWLIVVVLVFTGPVVSVLRNAALMPAASRFASRWDAADALLRASKGKGTVELEVPTRVGNLYYVTANPEHPSNVAVARYYGAERVVVRLPR